LAYAVYGKHEACALALMQKGAYVNVDVHPFPKENRVEAAPAAFRFTAAHFKEGLDEDKPFTIFQGAVQNGWLGVAYMALQQLEKFGMTSYATAVEVAYKMQKIQFAKTLIGKQVDVAKLRARVAGKRNLIHSLAYECGRITARDLQGDIVDILDAAGVKASDQDQGGNTALHLACLEANDFLVDKFVKEMNMDAKVLNNVDMTPLAALFWNFPKGDNTFSDEMFKKCLKTLLEAKANPDVLMPCKELSHLQSGYAPLAKANTNLPTAQEASDLSRSSPLIIAVVHRDSAIIEELIREAADLNFRDSRGMTPFLHAIKTNDLGIILQLLNKEGEVPSTDELLAQRMKPIITSDVDVNVFDSAGFNAIHHLIELEPGSASAGGSSLTFDNVDLLNVLLKLDVSIEDAPDGRSAAQMAMDAGAYEVAKHLGKSHKKSST